MAEGLCRQRWGDKIDCCSAGIESHGLNRLAVRAMHEIGIDIGGHRSKTIDDLGTEHFDLVITVCGHANESCPVFPGTTRVIHRGFDDPPRLAADSESDQDALVLYRRVRDEIARLIDELDELLAID
jgi:arsenate reductase